MTWKEISAEQNLRLAQKMLDQQTEINALRAELAATRSDRLRELSEENHRIHGVADQNPLDSYDYLIADAGEVEELAYALAAWMVDPASVPAQRAVAAEVADCVIILDHILSLATGLTTVEAVEAKVAADRTKRGVPS